MREQSIKYKKTALDWKINYCAADSALENGHIFRTRSLTRIAIHISFKLGAEPERASVLRPKSTKPTFYSSA
jgi:hypothetical protein